MVKIGEALRTVRMQLGLTQSQMCGDIVSRSFYAMVKGTLISTFLNIC